ncbi:type IV secretion system DNA-binding domain-containing protein [Mariprofundus ferrooxydans]|nr:type IV secretion system DNA-binding domain-containing protein [Mariprofundus ferrooxydans]
MSNLIPSTEKREWGAGFIVMALAALIGLMAGKIIGFYAFVFYAENYLNIVWELPFADFAQIVFYSSFDWLPRSMQTQEIYGSSLFFHNTFAAIAEGKLLNIYRYSGWFFAVISAAAVAPFLFKKHSNEIVKHGLEAIKNTKEAHAYAYKKLEKATKKGGEGICIHPGMNVLPWRNPKPLYITPGSETRHFFIAGASGSGKTQVIQHMMQASCSDVDALNIIFDFKSDFTASVPDWMPEGMEPLIFAPWDVRSAQWSIASDLRRFTDAEKLAASLIPAKAGSADPYWTDASRDIMSAVLICLSDQLGTAWGARELAAMFMSQPLLLQAIADYRPGAAKHISGEGGQTQGVEGALREAGQNLDSLARLWPMKCGVSLVDFVKYPRKRTTNTIIISGNLDMPFFYPVISSMLSVIMSTALTLPDSKTRKIYIYADELGRLPKIEYLEPAMTAGRSKGLRMILGIQDYGKLTEQYGKELSDTIISQCSTKILGKMNGGETQEFAEKSFGKQEVERLSSTLQAGGGGGQSTPGGDLDGAFGVGGNASTSWQRDVRSVVLGGEFAALPSSEDIGGPTLFAKLDGIDKVLKLWWPYQALPIVAENIIEKPNLTTLFDKKGSASALLEGDDDWVPEGSISSTDSAPISSQSGIQKDNNTDDKEANGIQEDAEHEETQSIEDQLFAAQGGDTENSKNSNDSNENDEGEEAGEKMVGDVAGAAIDAITGGVGGDLMAEGLDMLEGALKGNDKKVSSIHHGSKKENIKKTNKSRGM